MRLSELNPEFLRFDVRTETWSEIVGDHRTWRQRGCPTVEVTGPRCFSKFVNSLEEAQGIMFACPLCHNKRTRDGYEGSHSVMVAFANKGIIEEHCCAMRNKEGRLVLWNVGGSGFDDLTITPSILIQGGCGWHGFVTNGEVSIL